MRNTTNELSTVQRLNRLPIGTYIRFKEYDGMGYIVRYAEKVEAKGRTTTHGRGIKPFWIDLKREGIYFPQTRIFNFEVIDKDYFEIRKLEDSRDFLLEEIADAGTCERAIEAMKRGVENMNARIAELKAKLNADQEIEIA